MDGASLRTVVAALIFCVAVISLCINRHPSAVFPRPLQASQSTRHTEQEPDSTQFLGHPGLMKGVEPSSSGAFRFVVVGDWGTGGDTDEGHRQTLVAEALGAKAKEFHPQFVISTGDQMYSHGVTSKDDPLFDTQYESIYHPYKELQIPWYMSIGNHDCLGNVDAQVQYSTKSKTWRMPANYYSKEIRFGHSIEDRALFIVLDACALICGGGQDYRCEDDMKKNFHHSVEEQLIWLDNTLALDARWKFVIAHWPIFSFMGNGPSAVLEEILIPRFEKFKVQAYFSGHDHSLQHIRLVDTAGANPDFIVSGAGGYKLHPSLKEDADPEPNRLANSIFAGSTHGFVTAVLTRHTVQFDFISASNRSTIYTFTRSVN